MQKGEKSMICRRVRLWACVFIVFTVLVKAQISSAEPPEPPARVPIKVKGVKGELQLDNTITVEVENLTEYLEQPGKDAKKFTLYLDWRPLKGISSRLIDHTNKLQFDIIRSSDSKDEWNALLGRPFARGKGFTYMVPVSIGYENESPIPSDVEHSLIVISKPRLWIFVSFFALTFVLFMRLAINSSIIRDPCPGLEVEQMTYSLGRTQMAFWFFIVTVSFVLIWMITGDLDSLTDSALGLIGISAATALSATVVDSSKRKPAESKLQVLEKEKAVLQTRLNELGQQIAATPPPANSSALIKETAQKNARLLQVNNEIEDLTDSMKPLKSEGFLLDILTDADGISLHRFQIAIWTIVLGIIFTVSTYNNLAMPEFNDTLLALMGISGGTYIGFKFPEKHS